MTPISAAFGLPIVPPSVSLQVVYTKGIDTSTTPRYISTVNTEGSVDDGRTAATGTRDRGDGTHSACGKHLHRPKPESRQADDVQLRRAAEALLLPRLRTAAATLQAPVRR